MIVMIIMIITVVVVKMVMTILHVAPRSQHRHHFPQDINGRTGVVELSAAMVADDDSGEAEFGRTQAVLGSLDALEEDGQIGYGAEPGEVAPGEGWVDEC